MGSRENVPLLTDKPEEPDGEATSTGGLPLLFRVKGTVILSTWWQILLVIAYSGTIVGVDHYYAERFRLDLPRALIDILGVVTGLLLTFRTQTAYERYSEGRLLWSRMTCAIRNLTRLIWVDVDVGKHDSKSVVEKRSAINLLVAFAVATKHYLREEYSYEFEDLRNLISHLRLVHTPSSNLPLADQEIPITMATERVWRFKGDHMKAYSVVTPTNIPLELSYYIESIVNNCEREDKCTAGTIQSMRADLSHLVECLTSFERILRTPIPLAYSVHLTHMVWLYILALPYQLLEHLGWWTVPVVGIATFAFLGILQIGWEIENPFGYDANDLPLDDFCKVIRREIQHVVMRGPIAAEEWIYSDKNFPLIPDSYMSAHELGELSNEEINNLIRTKRQH